MNIAVGKVSDAARAVIEAVGGSIEGTLKPEVSMVTLPDCARAIEIDSTSQCIVIGGDKGTTLVFHRGWETEDCSLDILHKATVRKGEPGKAEILSLSRALRRIHPGRRVSPGEILALWFGREVNTWLSRVEAGKIVDASFPLGDKDAYIENGMIYVLADDRSAHIAFTIE